jgi:predicted ArsR family transcriptional regulator
LLIFLATHLSATIPEMAAELNLTENGVNYHLRKLQQTNKLKRVGGRKPMAFS